MENLTNFDKVNLTQALLVINEGGANQDILLDNGSVEMIKDIEEGTFNTYYTNFGWGNPNECEYVATTNLYSMIGDLSRVIDKLEKLK